MLITGVLAESIVSVRFCETMCVLVARLSPPPAPRSTTPLVVIVQVAVDVELARPQLHDAAKAVGLQRPRLRRS